MAGDKPINTMLTREQVQSGVMRDMLRAADPSIHVWTDDEHRASVAATLASRPDGGGDVWLFAYGSLIWNPMIHFSEKRIATVHGYHRRFCLWTHLGRGSVETPGLILGRGQERPAHAATPSIGYLRRRPRPSCCCCGSAR